MKTAKILILKNHPDEGAGIFLEYFLDHGIAFTEVDLMGGGRPPSSSDYSHLVIMGGPMNVYEEDRYPYIKDDLAAISSFMDRERPILGVCLGSQLLARHLGSRVRSGGKKEIGWHRLDFDEAARQYPAFAKFDVVETVFQWHGDTYDIPPGCTKIASSEIFPNQGFVWRDNVFALQFHIEVTRSIIDATLDVYAAELARTDNTSAARIARETARYLERLNKLALGFMSTFASL